jgi:hypothetical protein
MGKLITFTHKGDFKKTDRLFHNIIGAYYMRKLKKYGDIGVRALAEATPEESGKTAESWSYEIEQGHGYLNLYWRNSNTNEGVNIAVILQYGHGTRNGGYVMGIDYINPAIRPVFDQIANEAWKEVISS